MKKGLEGPWRNYATKKAQSAVKDALLNILLHHYLILYMFKMKIILAGGLIEIFNYLFNPIL